MHSTERCLIAIYEKEGFYPFTSAIDDTVLVLE